jgi:hypothetical protein
VKIDIATIPHEQQRYDTVGDWQGNARKAKIRVSETGTPEFNLCVAIHEVVEWYLCTRAGITDAAVDRFDMQYSGPGEPGDAADCPYRKQHQAATEVEKVVARVLGINWDVYDKTIEMIGD